MKNIKKKDIPPENHSSYKILCVIKTILLNLEMPFFFDITVFFQNSRKMAENQHKQQWKTKFMMLRVETPNRISQK